MFSNHASKILATVGQVGVLIRYMAESCHNSSSSAISTTPENRESRNRACSFALMGRSPVLP